MYHLAQLNVGRALAPLDDLQMDGFVRQLAEINALADESPGFVWRLQSESGDATDYRAFPDDPLMLLTLSVWEDVPSFRQFAYQSAHATVMQSRRQWFARIDPPYVVLWWIPAGTLLTIEEALTKLYQLKLNGATPNAFDVKQTFPPPSA